MSTLRGRFSKVFLVIIFIILTTSQLVAKDRFIEIDRKVDSALAYMLREIPSTEILYQNAKGILVIPVITKAGFFLGGSYGEGAFRVGDKTLDYFNAIQLNYGLQIGGQQYSQVIFFMTEAAKNNFLTSDGFKFGANAEAAVFQEGDFVGVDSLSSKTDVIGVIFGQQGILVGATLAGTVYDEIN